MKTLLFVTTCADNFPFFKECLRSLYENVLPLKDTHEFRIAICDFGKGTEIKNYVENNYNGICLYLKNEGASLPQNVNVGFQLCHQMNQDLFFYFNDDISLHKNFVSTAIDQIDGLINIGFLGGASQIGGWNEKLKDMVIPEPTNQVFLLYDIKRLNWEFSACCIPVSVIKRVGDMDSLFGRIGLCADNDYLLRIRKAGYVTIRHGGCTFWHSKAVTQSRMRNPLLKNDPWRKRVEAYMRMKWGVDINDLSVLDSAWDLPFNGREVRVLDEDRFEIEGHIVNLRKDHSV